MVLLSGKVLVEIFFFRLLCKRLFADDKEAAAARVPNEFLRSKERKKKTSINHFLGSIV